MVHASITLRHFFSVHNRYTHGAVGVIYTTKLWKVWILRGL